MYILAGFAIWILLSVPFSIFIAAVMKAGAREWVINNEGKTDA